MAEINTIKELHSFAKINKIMLDVINECSENCNDPVVKEKLIKTKEQINDIIAEENGICQKLTPDEAVIVLLLSFIREKEMNQSNDAFDIDILNDADAWLNNFKNKI